MLQCDLLLLDYKQARDRLSVVSAVTCIFICSEFDVRCKHWQIDFCPATLRALSFLSMRRYCDVF